MNLKFQSVLVIESSLLLYVNISKIEVFYITFPLSLLAISKSIPFFYLGEKAKFFCLIHLKENDLKKIQWSFLIRLHL